jgi:hypothetical protein
MSGEKRPRSSDMDANAHDMKAAKKAKSPTTTASLAAATATATNGFAAATVTAAPTKANSNGNPLPNNEASVRGNGATVTRGGAGNDSSVTVKPPVLPKSVPPKSRQETKAQGAGEGKPKAAAAAAATAKDGKAKESGGAETAKPKDIPKQALKSASASASASASSSWVWYYSILFWVAVLLFLTNVVTLGLWLETKMEHELRTVELQEQLGRLPEYLESLDAWMEHAGNIERHRNDCGEVLLELVRESGRECIDAEDGCSTWAEAGECFLNPGYMFLSCRVSCDAC